MCGIVAWFGSTPEGKITLQEIVEIAYRNRHRGESDGCGFLNMENRVGVLGRVRKTGFTLEELFELEVNKNRYEETVKKSNGQVTTWQTEEDSTKKRELKGNLLKFMRRNAETSAIIFHHRKKTYGKSKESNTHPILVKRHNSKRNIYYFHNGTAYVRPLETAMKMWHGLKLKGNTDTEVIGNLIEMLIEDEFDLDIISDTLSDFFPGYGVIIRAERMKSGNFQIDVFKDSDRSLYICTNESGMFLVSEPTLGLLDNISEIFDFSSGHIQINVSNDKRALVYSSEWAILHDRAENLDILRKIIEAGAEPSTVKRCDVCGENKAESVLRVKGTGRDLCISCFIDWTPEMKAKTTKQKIDILEYLPSEPLTPDAMKEIVSGKVPWPSGSLLFRSLSTCPIPRWLGMEMMGE